MKKISKVQLSTKSIFLALLSLALLLVLPAETKAQLSWRAFSGRIPDNAVIGGNENGVNLQVCRCQYKSATHPGRVVGSSCHIGWGGTEIAVERNFDVLVNDGVSINWEPVTGGNIPTNAFAGGQENGQTLYVGKALGAGGNVYPGKILTSAGSTICNYASQGQEIVAKTNFYVLTTGKAKPVNNTNEQPKPANNTTNIAPKPYTPDTKFYYNIESKAVVGQVLDVAYASTENGTNISLYANNNYKHQRFAFVPAGNGYYYIESALQKDMVLDVTDWGQTDGTNIQLIKKGGGTTAQQFKPMDAGNGLVQFVSAMGGNFYLGVANDNNNIVLRNSNLGNKVLFKLSKSEAIPQLPISKTFNATKSQILDLVPTGNLVVYYADLHLVMNGTVFSGTDGSPKKYVHIQPQYPYNSNTTTASAKVSQLAWDQSDKKGYFLEKLEITIEPTSGAENVVLIANAPLNDLNSGNHTITSEIPKANEVGQGIIGPNKFTQSIDGFTYLNSSDNKTLRHIVSLSKTSAGAYTKPEDLVMMDAGSQLTGTPLADLPGSATGTMPIIAQGLWQANNANFTGSVTFKITYKMTMRYVEKTNYFFKVDIANNAKVLEVSENMVVDFGSVSGK